MKINELLFIQFQNTASKHALYKWKEIIDLICNTTNKENIGDQLQTKVPFSSRKTLLLNRQIKT